MVTNGGGSIILVSSVCFWQAPEKLVCYTATKAALVGMTKSLAAEFGRHNIRVNALCPGWTMTQRQLDEMVTPEIKQKLTEEWQLLTFHITPEMLTPGFLFLASSASQAVTRQTLLMDAGLARG
jgi:NAD(P)-dependent dehydrogenase (short-subunit alcohol dehydrogenase family)